MRPLGMGIMRGQWLNDCGNVEKRAALFRICQAQATGQSSSQYTYGEEKGYTGPPAQRINTSNCTPDLRVPKSADKSESKDRADRGGK